MIVSRSAESDRIWLGQKPLREDNLGPHNGTPAIHTTSCPPFNDKYAFQLREPVKTPTGVEFKLVGCRGACRVPTPSRNVQRSLAPGAVRAGLSWRYSGPERLAKVFTHSIGDITHP